jgi:sRNA-binding carbon storage regulator CsrA
MLYLKLKSGDRLVAQTSQGEIVIVAQSDCKLGIDSPKTVQFFRKPLERKEDAWRRTRSI